MRDTFGCCSWKPTHDQSFQGNNWKKLNHHILACHSIEGLFQSLLCSGLDHGWYQLLFPYKNFLFLLWFHLSLQLYIGFSLNLDIWIHEICSILHQLGWYFHIWVKLFQISDCWSHYQEWEWFCNWFDNLGGWKVLIFWWLFKLDLAF